MVQYPECERHAPVLGNPVLIVDVDGGAEAPIAPAGAIVIGVHRHGSLPATIDGRFDLLLTVADASPRPWVRTTIDRLNPGIHQLRERVARHPLAASALATVLRINENLSFAQALLIESFAYSTLIGGAEFRDWRRAHPLPPHQPKSDQPIFISRQENAVCVALADPGRRNVFDARLRDALCEALHMVADDPGVTSFNLLGLGDAFSVGGDLREMGAASDLSAAHGIRTLRSPALLLHQLAVPTNAFLHGACIGAGIEVPAAARHVIARADTWFHLPEVSMGLIPGAGGTVSLPRRIGRHRTLYWALSNRRIKADLALQWGLIDAIGTSP